MLGPGRTVLSMASRIGKAIKTGVLKFFISRGDRIVSLNVSRCVLLLLLLMRLVLINPVKGPSEFFNRMPKYRRFGDALSSLNN